MNMLAACMQHAGKMSQIHACYRRHACSEVLQHANNRHISACMWCPALCM